MKEEHIRQLLDRFFDGDTTLDEERTLYEYFAEEQLPADMLPLREMFMALAGMKIKPEELRDDVASPAPPSAGHDKRWSLRPATIAKIAAGLVLPLALGIYLWAYDSANYCEGYFYSSHTTDSELVMDEVESVLAAIDSDEETQVDHQLKMIFGIEE